MDNKKPSTMGQRRKSGGSTQLRSPIVKRPPSAPVSLQGWLHKQGSEGLMLWKKRWFVLSEYCLFYYKGPEEEKLLGSILLPSYKVSPCTAQDKIYRKFAFKAEHANMRTYYFAAETRDSMTCWMNALSLATILQEGEKLQNQMPPSATLSSLMTKSSESSNSDFKSYRSSSVPVTTQPPSLNKNLEVNNGWVPTRLGDSYQPLYANAPPKPKRLNNEDQYGSSPEASPSLLDDAKRVTYGSRKQFQQSISSNRGTDYYHPYKPKISVESDMHLKPYSETMLEKKIPEGLEKYDVNYLNFSEKPYEKMTDCHIYSEYLKTNNRNINQEKNLMDSRKAPNQLAVQYQHSDQYYQNYRTAPQVSPTDYDKIRSFYYKKKAQPPRPHSADFLDYDSKQGIYNKENKGINIGQRSQLKTDPINSRPPRPKSSLDILHGSDGYYWSEERYAEKMRQSAIYLQNTLPQRSQSSRANTPSLKQLSENKSTVDYTNFISESINSVVKPVVLSEINKADSFVQNLKKWSENGDRSNSYFVRSASARLPKQRTGDEDSDEVQIYTGGEDFNDSRKEDSMKRLLEWKQRMLQSPLTRKPSGSFARGIAQNELSKSYKQQLLKELERQETESKRESGKKRLKSDNKRILSRTTDGRSSSNLSSDRYYNYSSDDEEKENCSDKKPRRGIQVEKPTKEEDKTKEISLMSNLDKNMSFISPDYENVAHTQKNSEKFNGGSRTYGDMSASVKEISFSKTDVEKKQIEEDLNSETKNLMVSNSGSECSNKAREAPVLDVSDSSGVRTKYLGITRQNHNSPFEKSNWNEKMDESKLIKEFSYQYIKQGECSKSLSDSYRVLDAPPENIVKSRIKQLGLEEQIETESREIASKEPSKASLFVYSSNEENISNIKAFNDSFPLEKNTAFFEESKQNPKSDAKNVSEKHQKSVRDLLADFERKSQLFQEKEAAIEQEESFDEVPGKRYVFSDTETLLYDSSSDTEKINKKPDSTILNNFNKSGCRKGIATELSEEEEEEEMEEEDRDEEVAAVLSRNGQFFNSSRDLSRKKDSSFNANQHISKQMGIEPSPSSEVETIMTPAYLRSSLTELDAVLENSDSTCSISAVEREKDCVNESILKDNFCKSVEEPVLEPKEENCEGHYMPMTPSKRVSAPSSDKSRSNSSLHSFLINAEETYVEMAENSFSSTYSAACPLSTIKKKYLDQDGPGYCEIKNNQESHYDFLYRSTSLREPEYMEVNTLLEILKEQDEKIKEHKDAVEDVSKRQNTNMVLERVPPTPPRSVLPDILNSSSASQKFTKSDSSDADDESSKDLDSLDVPRHPRFSLSDTFRPASYYLGNTISERKSNLIKFSNQSENHDSSDSDLVSPPPIPTFPPLLDDLDTSLETEKSLELRPNISKKKIERGGSKKVWSEVAQQMDLDIDKKRRPLSEDVLQKLDHPLCENTLVFNELDAVGSRNGLVFDDENSDINLDKYLEELQLSGNINANLYSKDFSESIYKSCEKEIHRNLMPKESISKTDSNEKTLLKLRYPEESSSNNEKSLDQTKTENEVQYENLQTLLFPPPPPELYDSANDQSDRESALAYYSNVSFPEVPPPDIYCDVYEPEEATNSKVSFHPVMLQQPNVDENVVNKPVSLENQGAPYYYSDIIKNDRENFDGLSPDRTSSGVRSCLSSHRLQTLNNQRDDLQETNQVAKRNDIGRKVNPISDNYLAENHTSNLDEVQKITAELRTTSAHFMGTADKSGSVDMRNIYESDTLQRRKVRVSDEHRVKTSDSHHSKGVSRNLYPHGLKDKSVGSNLENSNGTDGKFSAFRSRSWSRSLEGLLNDIDLPTKSRPETSNNSRPQNDSLSNHYRIPSCDGNEPWEKDAIWRENLRKASLRHTRSLDNLEDGISNPSRNLNLSFDDRITDSFDSNKRNADTSTSTGRRSADHFSGPSKLKLSREVTYVNDNFRKMRQLDLSREYEQDYREGKAKFKKRGGKIQTVVELSDSGVLDCDDGVHYEKLIRNPTNLERPSLSRNYMDDMQSRDKPEEKKETEKSIVVPVQKTDDSYPCKSQTQVNSTQGTFLKPIDREKLRQWDLMSSGIVDQEVKKKSDSQITTDKTLNVSEIKKDVEKADGAKSGENKSQLQSSSLEASSSGFATRDTELSVITSVDSHQNQKSLEPSLSVSTKKDNLLDCRSDSQLMDRNLNKFTGRVDYFDREKLYVNSLNGYNEWSESYSDKEKNLLEGETAEYLEKGRSISENEYYLSKYPEKNFISDYTKGSFSLTIPKNEISISMNSGNLQMSPGRTPEGSFLTKEKSVKRKMTSGPWGLDVSAGELLGRTHEELVLLLIQLRRQSASICKAMEACHIEIEEQARMVSLDTPTRLEHIRKLEKLKKHLLELEKQYEKGKPLVNLVDNMVKLGSLYKGNNHVYNSSLGLDYNSEVREKLEFNQKVQEQRLLAEERRDWDRLSPDHGQLQAKVQQLYKLDRLLQEESGTLHSLQQDKELLEKALGGLRHKLQISRSNPIEADRYRKQQILLERELSRVRLLLAHNSKKLEETVAENARLEQELVILRQKLQASRGSSRNSVPLVPESATWSTAAALEAELRRVQQLVGDLQRQRHELSAQVKQLTEKSDNLVQQIRPGPTGVAGAGPIPGKKKSSSTWMETDLDLLVTQDVSVENSTLSPQQTPVSPVSPESRSTTPIYINTDTSKKENDHFEDCKSPNKAENETNNKTYCTPVELSEADERVKRFYGIIPKEKQEIKTVRIVKRESERRQRDRDRSGNIGIPVGNTAVAKRVSVIEENDNFGLERVDEESYENNRYSPNMSENTGEYKNHEFINRERKLDCFLNFHSTNPLLLQNIEENPEETFNENHSLRTIARQKSLSLPRTFGKNNFTHQPFKIDDVYKSKGLNLRRNRVRFENLWDIESENGSECNSPYNDSSKYYPSEADYSLSSAHLKNFNFAQKSRESGDPVNLVQWAGNAELNSDTRTNELEKERLQKDSTKGLTATERLFSSDFCPRRGNSPQLSPVYQSEAAKEIIMEMSNNSAQKEFNRRQIRKEKRRHHTVSNIRHISVGNEHLKMGSARSRDDLDMERALRPRINAPDVVRSTMSQKDLKYNESTIDSILGTPNKIIIPERYIPEQEQLTAEEQLQRIKKAESIRKMLSETTALSTPDISGEGGEEEKKSCTLRKKVEEEKKQREHLLELNQILAQQVMEKSKIVAVKALAALPLDNERSFDEDELSPVQSLPLYQQRENFFS